MGTDLTVTPRGCSMGMGTRTVGTGWGWGQSLQGGDGGQVCGDGVGIGTTGRVGDGVELVPVELSAAERFYRASASNICRARCYDKSACPSVTSIQCRYCDLNEWRYRHIFLTIW